MAVRTDRADAITARFLIAATGTLTKPKLARIEGMTRDLGDAAKSAKSTAADAQTLVSRVKQGQGTAGAMLRDEALYDDLSELVRDLKHTPGKLIWKE